MLKLRQDDFEAIRRHGEETYPAECCGVLVGTRTEGVREVRAAVPCANAEAEWPQRRYRIDLREVVHIQREAREQGWEIVGIYHSHPDHSARWSPTDLEDACWTLCSYVITAVQQGKAAQTLSFVLTGTREEDKAFAAEEIVID